MCVCMCLFMLGMKFFIKKTILLSSMHSSNEYRNQMALNDLQSRECISLWIRIFIKMNCRCDWMTWVFYEYISILSRHLSDTFGVQTAFVVYTSCHLFHMPIWSLWSLLIAFRAVHGHIRENDTGVYGSLKNNRWLLVLFLTDFYLSEDETNIDIIWNWAMSECEK